MVKVIERIVYVILVIVAMLIMVFASVSGPYFPDEEPPETGHDPLPSLEDLIPQGARTDSDTTLRVLLVGEIEEMPFEHYLIGVVAAEMPASFEFEALKAQAVAARTNAMYTMQVTPNARHPDTHVCTDPACCMAYSSDERLREKWDNDYLRNIRVIIRAVIETDGIYMSYKNEPILALFHSSSAGKTETSGNVWLMDLPYLQTADSPESAGNVPNFVSTATVSSLEFRQTVIDIYPEAVFGDDEDSWITDITYTESGRILELTLGGAAVKGTELRSMFDLRSTAVSIGFTGGDVVFTVTGYGHGVGMSQYGANKMAVDGKNFREILSHYYTGITFSNAKHL